MNKLSRLTTIVFILIFATGFTKNGDVKKATEKAKNHVASLKNSKQ